MSKKVFIWLAHPQAGTFCGALADAYQHGAQDSGADVRRMDLSQMQFDGRFTGYKDAPELEPDLLAWQDNIAWADHLLIVHPNWWGAMPARAKDALDRGLTSGFAYKYQTGPGIKWDKLLEGRTADIIITADTPTWVDNLFYGKSVRRTLKDRVLGFCGVKTRKAEMFGSIKLSDEARRAKWLAQAKRMGASLSA